MGADIPATVVYALSWLSLIGTVAPWGVYLLPVMALPRVRVAVSDTSVRLTGWDPVAMNTLAFALGLLLPLLVGRFGWGALAGAVALVGSCRVDVTVAPRRARVARRILWVVPWWWRTSREPPVVAVDGWGDLEAPEALQVDDITLGWNASGSGVDCDALARRFQDAVAALAR